MMVREFLRGGAAVNVLARAHGARVRVVDLGVDDDLADTPPEVRRHKVRRGSGAHRPGGRPDRSRDRGRAERRPRRSPTRRSTPAPTSWSPATWGSATPRSRPPWSGPHSASTPTTWSVGAPASTTPTWRGKHDVIAAALERARPLRDDPVALLRTVGSADLAAATGFLVRAAERGTPVLLDGVVSGACALLAERMAPGAAAWWCAGHRSTEPAHRLALESLGLLPAARPRLRLGEASGALTALPLLRTAPLLLAEMSTLAVVIEPAADAVPSP